MTTTSPGPRRTGGAVGPPLAAPAAIYVALFSASLIGTAVSTGTYFPSPYDPVATLQAFVAQHPTALTVGATLQFASAIPLAIFTAVVVARLHHLGARAPGVTIALVGGVLAVTFLLLSAGFQWTLALVGGAADPDVLRALQGLAFVTGGAGYVVPFGLLVLGVTIVGGFTRLLPRWVVVLGVVVAATAELATISLVMPALSVLLPMARFGGFVWLLAVGVLLPRSRPQRDGMPRRPAPDQLVPDQVGEPLP